MVRVRAHTSGIPRTNLTFSKMVERSKSFRPVFKWAQRELEQEWVKNFRSQGASSGQPWMPLDSEYARWKLANYGPLPSLVREGDLYKDVRFISGPPSNVGMHEAVFGIDAPSAKFHQSGTRDMPARRLIFVPRFFAERLAKVTLNYVTSGNVTGISFGDARGLFRT